jgi:hypothetical protein
MRRMSLVYATAVVVGLAMLGPGRAMAAAQDHQHDPQAQAQQTGQMKMGQMKMDAMKMDEMAARQKANTERINALMTQVKTASGDAKIAAMADVIGVLLEERAAMQEHCAAMHAMMNK